MVMPLTFSIWSKVSYRVVPYQAHYSSLVWNSSLLFMQKPKIKGIRVGARDINITQYADDTTVFLKKKTESEWLFRLTSWKFGRTRVRTAFLVPQTSIGVSIVIENNQTMSSRFLSRIEIRSEKSLTNRMWLSVVCTLIDNNTRHHSGQNVVKSRGAAAEWVRNKFWPLWWRVSLSIRVHTTLNHIRFVFYHNIKHNE